MKNLLLLFILVAAAQVCFAQKETQETSNRPIIFVSTLSTYQKSIVNSIHGFKEYTVDPLNSVWISLPSNKRIGFSVNAYKQNALPFSSNELNFEITAFYGQKREFYKIKFLDLYTAWDLGIGKSKYDYNMSTETDIIYNSSLSSYVHGDFCLGLEFSIGKRIFIVAESQYYLHFADAHKQDYNLVSGLLEGPMHRSFEYTQGWIPLRALAFGWKI
jgi:hypothetical protein